MTAAIQEGTADHFLREVGAALDDFTLARGANGKIGTERALFHLHTAQCNLYRRSYERGAHPSQLARKVTLTEDANNENFYVCPPRATKVFAVEDSNGVQYSSYKSRHYHYRAGFLVERNLDTTTRQSRLTIHFMNYTPTGTVYAWVLEEPVRLSGGDGTYGAASLTLEETPDLGITVMDDDYYIGTQFVVTEAAADAFGLIQTCTDYVGKTKVATVGTWSTKPTANDDYSVLCELPRVCWRQVVLETVRIITRVDKRFGRMREDLMDELREVREDTILALRNPSEYFDNMPRQVTVWII